MAQILHGSATTTEAIRRAIQHSQASLRALSRRYGINQKTVAKWKRRTSVADIPTGAKNARSTVLSVEEEAVVVAFRRHTLLPLDDCLYALQPTIPHLTRSSLHRCLQRNGISQLPKGEGEASAKRQFKVYPIGYFHIEHRGSPHGARQALPACGDRPHVQIRLRRTSREGRPPHGGRLPPPLDRRCALQGSHRADRQRHSFHDTRQHRLSRS